MSVPGRAAPPAAESGGQLRWLPYVPYTGASRAEAKTESPRAAAVRRRGAAVGVVFTDHFRDRDSAVRPVQAEEIPLPEGEPFSKSRFRSSADRTSTGQGAPPFSKSPSGLRWATPQPASLPISPPAKNQDPMKTVTVDDVPYTEQKFSDPPNPELTELDEELLKHPLEPDLCLSVRSLTPINKLTTDIRLKVKRGAAIPHECPWGEEERFQPRDWEPVTFCWTASALCHKPLYFEDVQLERYGHSLRPWAQPFASGAHFFLTVPILPYKMGLTPPCECIYTLGYYRPGSCAPYLIDPIPLSVRAGLLEAGAWVGAAALIP
ncbi:MAG: hypothetical protein JXB10_13820 [Pirellulales bacterium]|nr:hypothetical protein [Pirellulales bacterium]